MESPLPLNRRTLLLMQNALRLANVPSHLCPLLGTIETIPDPFVGKGINPARYGDDDAHAIATNILSHLVQGIKDSSSNAPTLELATMACVTIKVALTLTEHHMEDDFELEAMLNLQILTLQNKNDVVECVSTLVSRMFRERTAGSILEILALQIVSILFQPDNALLGNKTNPVAKALWKLSQVQVEAQALKELCVVTGAKMPYGGASKKAKNVPESPSDSIPMPKKNDTPLSSFEKLSKTKMDMSFRKKRRMAEDSLATTTNDDSATRSADLPPGAADYAQTLPRTGSTTHCDRDAAPTAVPSTYSFQRRELSPITTRPTRSVLFGSENPEVHLGLSASGIDYAHFDTHAHDVGYSIPLTWFPSNRPTTAPFPTLATTAKTAGGESITMPSQKIKSLKLQRRPHTQESGTAILKARWRLRKDGDVIVPNGVRDGVNLKASMLPPNLLVDVVASNRMPTNQSQRTGSATDYVLTRVGATTPASRTGARKQSLRGRTGVVLPLESELESRRVILKSILAAPGWSVVEVSKLARDEHRSIMGHLFQQYSDTKKDERSISKSMLGQIMPFYRSLSMKFLFTTEGGPAKCRKRLTIAIAFWVDNIELSFLGHAVEQWQAFVESCRFAERFAAYKRQVGYKLLHACLKKMILASRQRAFFSWIHKVRWEIWSERENSSIVVQTFARKVRDRANFVRWHVDQPINGRLRDMYLVSERENVKYKVHYIT